MQYIEKYISEYAVNNMRLVKFLPPLHFDVLASEEANPHPHHISEDEEPLGVKFGNTDMLLEALVPAGRTSTLEPNVEVRTMKRSGLRKGLDDYDEKIVVCLCDRMGGVNFLTRSTDLLELVKGF